MIRVRHKLILLVALVVLAVSTGFTWLNLSLAQRAIEEDLERRAIVYAREVAATLADGRRLEGGEALGRLIERLMAIRRSVLQLDVLALGEGATAVVATSHPGRRLPVVASDADEIRNGRVETIPVNVRIVAATNRDLRKLTAEGAFRDDLYYRLNVVTIAMPALRERALDLPLLAQHFLEKFAHVTGRPVKRLAPEALALLTAYHWPGNVRELEHVIERAGALSASDTLLPDDFPAHLREESERAPRLPAAGMTLEDVKRWYVTSVLEEAGGNKLRAAELLGIDRRTLYRILDRQAAEDEG